MGRGTGPCGLSDLRRGGESRGVRPQPPSHPSGSSEQVGWEVALGEQWPPSLTSCPTSSQPDSSSLGHQEHKPLEPFPASSSPRWARLGIRERSPKGTEDTTQGTDHGSTELRPFFTAKCGDAPATSRTPMFLGMIQLYPWGLVSSSQQPM